MDLASAVNILPRSVGDFQISPCCPDNGAGGHFLNLLPTWFSTRRSVWMRQQLAGFQESLLESPGWRIDLDLRPSSNGPLSHTDQQLPIKFYSFFCRGVSNLEGHRECMNKNQGDAFRQDRMWPSDNRPARQSFTQSVITSTNEAKRTFEKQQLHTQNDSSSAPPNINTFFPIIIRLKLLIYHLKRGVYSFNLGPSQTHCHSRFSSPTRTKTLFQLPVDIHIDEAWSTFSVCLLIVLNSQACSFCVFQSKSWCLKTKLAFAKTHFLSNDSYLNVH